MPWNLSPGWLQILSRWQRCHKHQIDENTRLEYNNLLNCSFRVRSNRLLWRCRRASSSPSSFFQHLLIKAVSHWTAILGGTNVEYLVSTCFGDAVGEKVSSDAALPFLQHLNESQEERAWVTLGRGRASTFIFSVLWVTLCLRQTVGHLLRVFTLCFILSASMNPYSRYSRQVKGR